MLVLSSTHDYFLSLEYCNTVRKVCQNKAIYSSGSVRRMTNGVFDLINRAWVDTIDRHSALLLIIHHGW